MNSMDHGDQTLLSDKQSWANTAAIQQTFQVFSGKKQDKTKQVFSMPFQVQFTHRSLNKTIWHSQVERLNYTGAPFKASCD